MSQRRKSNNTVKLTTPSGKPKKILTGKEISNGKKLVSYLEGRKNYLFRRVEELASEANNKAQIYKAINSLDDLPIRDLHDSYRANSSDEPFKGPLNLLDDRAEILEERREKIGELSKIDNEIYKAKLELATTKIRKLQEFLGEEKEDINLSNDIVKSALQNLKQFLAADVKKNQAEPGD